MKERPILMNAEMVRAVLDGRKTQTRRPVKPQPYTIPWRDAYGNADEALFWRYAEPREDWPYPRFCPFGQPGDRLWVRETWQEFFDDEMMPLRPRGPRGRLGSPDTPDRGSYVFYRADGPVPVQPPLGRANWRPSIHMPRWASRIALEITDVRVERVQDITEDDAIADAGLEAMIPEHIWYIPGEDLGTTRDPIYAFEHVWDACYGKTHHAWTTNPWVWVVEFRRVQP